MPTTFIVVHVVHCGSTMPLTHWGQVTHICVSKLTIIGSDNGLSPGRRQAIIWTNAGILLIGHLGTNFSEILIRLHIFSFKKMHLKMSCAKWRQFCLGLNVLIKQMHCLSIPFTSAVVPLKFRNWKVIHPTFYQAHIYAEIELIGIENISHESLQYDWLPLGPLCNLYVH